MTQVPGYPHFNLLLGFKIITWLRHRVINGTTAVCLINEFCLLYTTNNLKWNFHLGNNQWFYQRVGWGWCSFHSGETPPQKNLMHFMYSGNADVNDTANASVPEGTRKKIITFFFILGASMKSLVALLFMRNFWKIKHIQQTIHSRMCSKPHFSNMLMGLIRLMPMLFFCISKWMRFCIRKTNVRCDDSIVQSNLRPAIW